MILRVPSHWINSFFFTCIHLLETSPWHKWQGGERIYRNFVPKTTKNNLWICNHVCGEEERWNKLKTISLPTTFMWFLQKSLPAYSVVLQQILKPYHFKDLTILLNVLANSNLMTRCHRLSFPTRLPCGK